MSSTPTEPKDELREQAVRDGELYLALMEFRQACLNARSRLHMTGDVDGTTNDIEVAQSRAVLKLSALFESHCQKRMLEAVDKKLATLSGVVPHMGLCESDSDKILIWVNNHRWSLVAPPGTDSTNQTTEGEL